MIEKIKFLLKALENDGQKHFKAKISFILLIVLIGAVIEFINFSFIIPILSKMSENINTESDYDNLFFLRYLFQFDIIELLFYTIIIVFIKNTIQFTGIYLMNKFSHSIEASISRKLFLSDLNLSLESVKAKNTSESINNTISLAFNINRYFVLPLISIITDSFVLISILVFLLVISPEITLMSILLFGFFQYGYNKFLGKKFIIWGKIKIKADEKRLKIIQESLGSIIDIKINNKHSFFLDKYKGPNNQSCEVGVYQNSFNQLPRFYFEVLMYLFLLLTVIVINNYLGSNPNTLILLGVFAASLLKALPILNKLISSYHSINFSEYSFELIKKTKFINPKKTKTEDEFVFKNKIELKNISFGYEGNENLTLKDLNLEIHKGQSYAIIGESGSGKSTFINILLGLLIPKNGQVLCDGESIHNKLDAWHKNIGFVPQDIYLIDDTVKNNILFGLNYSKIDESRLWKAIKQSQLDEFITCKKDLEINIGERGLMISGGQKQRIGIARVLYKNPEIIIFDESTSSLDASNEKEIFNTIQSLADKKTIIVISHNEKAIRFCQNKFHIN